MSEHDLAAPGTRSAPGFLVHLDDDLVPAIAAGDYTIIAEQAVDGAPADLVPDRKSVV